MELKGLEQFIGQLEDFSKWGIKKQVDFIAYFLARDNTQISFTQKSINDVFTALVIKGYPRLPQYLSEESQKKIGKYIKAKSGGYQLSRGTYMSIKEQIDNHPKQILVSKQLLDLIEKVTDGKERNFLEEAILCYKVSAFRAFIIMIWILAMSHLQQYIFTDKLTEFNSSLSIDSDKKISKIKITSLDDFSEIKEEKFIELMRTVKIISKDVRRILDERLGTRNSAAHPSGISIDGHKATEFASDLINNVLLKYQ